MFSLGAVWGYVKTKQFIFVNYLAALQLRPEAQLTVTHHRNMTRFSVLRGLSVTIVSEHEPKCRSILIS